MSRLNSEGHEIVGTEPDCIADGNVTTLWDCECRECRGLQREWEDQFEPEPVDSFFE